MAGLVINVQSLLATAYDEYAVEAVHDGSSGDAGLKAAELAKSLESHSYNHQIAHAMLLSQQGRDDEALTEFHLAISNAPADPFVWQNFIRFKISLGQFDEELRHAIERVTVLAPRTYSLHLDNAQLAVEYWHFAGPEIQRLWLYSIKLVLDVDAETFLWSVFLGHHETVLCHDVGLKSLKLQYWCPAADHARLACRSRFASAEAKRACGIVPNSGGMP